MAGLLWPDGGKLCELVTPGGADKGRRGVMKSGCVVHGAQESMNHRYSIADARNIQLRK